MPTPCNDGTVWPMRCGHAVQPSRGPPGCGLEALGGHGQRGQRVASPCRGSAVEESPVPRGCGTFCVSVVELEGTEGALVDSPSGLACRPGRRLPPPLPLPGRVGCAPAGPAGLNKLETNNYAVNVCVLTRRYTWPRPARRRTLQQGHTEREGCVPPAAPGIACNAATLQREGRVWPYAPLSFSSAAGQISLAASRGVALTIIFQWQPLNQWR